MGPTIFYISCKLIYTTYWDVKLYWGISHLREAGLTCKSQPCLDISEYETLPLFKKKSKGEIDNNT